MLLKICARHNLCISYKREKKWVYNNSNSSGSTKKIDVMSQTMLYITTKSAEKNKHLKMLYLYGGEVSQASGVDDNKKVLKKLLLVLIFWLAFNWKGWQGSELGGKCNENNKMLNMWARLEAKILFILRF